MIRVIAPAADHGARRAQPFSTLKRGRRPSLGDAYGPSHRQGPYVGFRRRCLKFPGGRRSDSRSAPFIASAQLADLWSRGGGLWWLLVGRSPLAGHCPHKSFLFERRITFVRLLRKKLAFSAVEADTAPWGQHRVANCPKLRNEVPPVSWTPKHLRFRSPLCQRNVPHTRPSSGGR